MNDFIAKIEGHGSLDIDWSKESVKLNIHEGERLFEGILVGRTAEEMQWITPRICGVCPIAHNLASLAAVETAYNIKIKPSSILLRELMQCGQMIQSHALHLFFLSLPDYLGIDRGTELKQKNPSVFKHALNVKKISDEIAALVSGRNVHPTRSTIGGFHKVPSQLELKNLLANLEDSFKSSQKTADLASQLDYPELAVNLRLAALENGKIKVVFSENIDKKEEDQIKDYKQVIEEEVKEYSTAKFGRYKGQEMLVGSLARLAVYGNYDKKYKLDFENPFHNNFAQAIEIELYHQKAINLVKELLKMDLDDQPVKAGNQPSLKGIGAIEAPRGGLYHEVHLNKQGIIQEANIITPTVQNLTSIEKSAHAILAQTKNRSQKKLERLMIMLVRAYDPCITCSVH